MHHIYVIEFISSSTRAMGNGGIGTKLPQHKMTIGLHTCRLDFSSCDACNVIFESVTLGVW